MKKTAILSLILSALLITAFRTKSPVSAKEFQKFLKKSAYTYIPSGKTFVDGKETNVQSFYISKGEVTNFQYREFLTYLKTQNELEKLKICQIDSANWTTKTSMNKGMEEHYHDHPAYRNYPVVNISHEAAELYCAFVQESFQRQFGVAVICRLPQYAEYVRAARGENSLTSYAWGGSSTRNSKGKILGNFAQIGEECVTRNAESGKYEINLKGMSSYPAGTSLDLLAPSESYWPNQFGVYNLSGNAAEMINEKGIAVGGSWNSPGYDVRIDSKKTFTGTDRTVGFRVVFTYLDQKK